MVIRHTERLMLPIFPEGFWPQMFPSCTFVPLVVNDFANCTTTESRS